MYAAKQSSPAFDSSAPGKQATQDNGTDDALSTAGYSTYTAHTAKSKLLLGLSERVQAELKAKDGRLTSLRGRI